MELINNVGFTILAFIFVLGVMIFVHELGHYLVAKYLGIGVEVFSLGFGPRLIGFRRGETDYRVSVLPLGGYVKMKGEHYDEDGEDSPNSFLARPKLHRFAVAIAGPLMNIGLAVLLLAINFMIGVQIPNFLSEPPRIGLVEEESPAEEAGLQVGDLIHRINEQEITTWQEAELAVGITGRQQPLRIVVDREGRSFETELVSDAPRDRSLTGLGVSYFVPFLVREVTPDSPAAEAGLQSYDEIVRVEGPERWAVGFLAAQRLISTHEGVPLRLLVRREGEPRLLEKTVVPRKMDDHTVIGASVELPTRTEKYGPIGALRRSVERNYEVTVLVFGIIGKLITGQASMQALSGPIEIARFSGAAASAGYETLIMFMALISLQLGILNLLPIPILDGGVITLLAIEGLIGRDLSIRAKERIAQAGFIFIILLMGFVIFNDLAKNLPFLH